MPGRQRKPKKDKDPAAPKKERKQTHIAQLRSQAREDLKKAKAKVRDQLRELRGLGIKPKAKKS